MPRLVIFDNDEIKAFDSPPILSAEQRDKYFALSDKLLLLMKKLTSPTNKICLVVQWGYFRATGRFFSPKNFRKTDIAYVAGYSTFLYQKSILIITIIREKHHGNMRNQF